ncbi:MAG: YdcF family protein [Lachnospiraceae bacterium]|nr:YdcF family protein [Lachnospiraceae bacterium]
MGFRIKKVEKQDLLGISKYDLNDYEEDVIDEDEYNDARALRWSLIRRTCIMVLCAIIAVVFFFYGICIAAVNSGSKFFLIWFLGAAVFALPAVVLFKGYTIEITGVLKAALIAAVSVLLLIFVITQFMVLSGFSAAGQKNLDYIIVLGAQVKDDGPSVVLRYRLDAAVEYCKENPNTIVIVSGGQGGNESSTEASVMRDYLVRKGVNINKILVEDKSSNTDQNIDYSAEFLDKSANTVGIVTNNFHVTRAVLLAKGAGYEKVYGISAGSSAFYLPNNMLRETAGIMKDFLFGHFSK